MELLRSNNIWLFVPVPLYFDLVFAPDPFTTSQIHELDNLKVEFEDTGKPPSQRLRAVLYRLWEQTPEGYKVFNDFYIAKMEKLIEHFKEKLV